MIDVAAHFGLCAIPFGKLPPSRAFTSSDLTIVTEKLRCLELVGGIAVCIGEPGVGKTYAIEAWETKLCADSTTVVWIDDPGCHIYSFLRRCVLGLNLKPLHNVDTLWQQFHTAFMKHHETNKHLIFIVDEAHQLPLTVLDQIRRLTNLARAGTASLSFVLIGHRELLSPFTTTKLNALRRRLTTVITIQGLSADEFEPYIQHHLTVAGTEKTLFSDTALKRLWNGTRGVPRLINTLALHCLLAVARNGGDRVDQAMAEAIFRQEELL
ncbi:ExeA family protein [candidate division CSSED10-310 bacterium]|uniref:ExeA family protein n=1 Tax=candidate division CSSED10-310 bacterium TaxID=2855610 RepID=A0ABV6Z5G3_UNCC1